MRQMMTAVTLTRWGNSLGVRIPAHLLKKIKAYLGERFELSVNKQGGLTLIPINSSHERWLEAFNTAADTGNDQLFIEDVKNNFDQDEWKW
jgi:antitoxin component of MazEF toxin-antitoxin module